MEFKNKQSRNIIFFVVLMGVSILLTAILLSLGRGISSGDLHEGRYADSRRESMISGIWFAEESYYGKNGTYTDSWEELAPFLGGEREHLDYKRKTPYFLQIIDNGQDFITGARLDSNQCYVCRKAGCSYEALENNHC